MLTIREASIHNFGYDEYVTINDSHLPEYISSLKILEDHDVVAQSIKELERIVSSCNAQSDISERIMRILVALESHNN